MQLPDDQLSALLKESKLIDEKKLAEATAYAASEHLTLRKALLEKEFISDEDLGKAIAKFLKVPFVVVSSLQIPDEVLNIIPERIARTQKAVVFGRDQTGVRVALADPSKTEFLNLISKKTGGKVVVHYATPRDIEHSLRLFKPDLQKVIDNFLRENIDRPARAMLEDPPVAKIVDALIDTAYQGRASDIHIEPHEENSVVRFRVDGMLHDVLTFPKSLHDRITTRIKVLSSLRTDEHLSAQDGKMRQQEEEELLDIRVSIIPIADGEKVALRLLSSRTSQYTLASLGMNEQDLKKLTAAFSKSYGMILSTGPTGSGKTTTIYSIVKIINTPEKNITTIEDPIEYRIRNANQVQVNAKTNLTFANGLRALLRQDPNVVFVGEIRDSETAGIAVNAALTGHLVLSTLHTNDAATALPRLIDMKVEPFLVASTVTVIVAQRLVRKICDQCKTSIELNLSEFEKNFPAEILERNFGNKKEIAASRGKGCKACRLSGYSGRIGLFEVLEITPEIRKLIIAKSDSDIIAKAAVKEGMKTLVDDGLQKVLAGETTIDEILRVTKTEFL